MNLTPHPGLTGNKAEIMLDDLEDFAAVLEKSDDYRVLRRLKEPWLPTDLEGLEVLHGEYVDTETTGLGDTSEVVELAMVPFVFTKEGLMGPGGEPYHSYNEPGIPIEEEALKTHGITMEKVKGHKIDFTIVQERLGRSQLVIAHNAVYDRRILERLIPGFDKVCWGCSMAEVPWPSKSRKLEHILMTMGWFYDAHGAMSDCMAGVRALQEEVEGKTALAHLIESARQTGYHIWTIDSPFSTKDALKARKYFWNDGTDGRPKAWHKEVKETELEDEKAWLAREVYRRAVHPARFDKVTAFDRFSVRG